MGKMPGVVEDLELAAGHGGVGETAVAEGNDRIVATPDEERRQALGQIGPVQHRDYLAPPVHPRPQGAKNGPPGGGVGKRIEDGQQLLGIPAQCGSSGDA